MGNNPVKFSYKQIWFIAYPILISLVMEQLIGMTDTAFMGRVGEVELGASAIAGVYYMTFYMIAFGFSLGAQIIMGRRNGEGNYAKIGPIFYKGTYFLLGVALVLFVSSHFVSPLILERFIDSPHVHEAAVSYIRWRVYGFFFSFDHVPHISHCTDHGTRLAEFLSERPDMHIQSSRLSFKIDAPDTLQDNLTRHNDPGIVEQQL